MLGAAENDVIFPGEIPLRIQIQWVFPVSGVQIGTGEEQLDGLSCLDYEITNCHIFMRLAQKRLDVIVTS